MGKSAKKPGRSIRPARSPVIAIRMPAPVYDEIKKTAATAEMTLSEYVARLIMRGQEWEETIGDARKLLNQARLEAKRIVKASLEAELRRRNWRHDAAGRWAPPEVHGLPPDGFNPAVADPNLFTPATKQLDADTVAEIKRAVMEALMEGKIK